jgi:hypothetical protein
MSDSEYSDTEFNLPSWSNELLSTMSDNSFMLLCSSEKVSNLPVWDRQRFLEKDRVEDIINYQEEYYKEYNSFNFVGIYYVCSIQDTDPRIIDGQHRLMAIKELSKDYPSFFCAVWYSSVQNEQERVDIFQLLNLARPVNIPDFMQDYKRDIINESCEHFFTKYKKFFSNNILGQPKRPNIRLDDLKNNLYTKKVVDSLDISDSKQLISLIENINTYYSNREIKYFPKIGKTDTQNIFKRAKNKGGLFIGLFPDYSWIDEMITIHTYKREIEASSSPTEKKETNKNKSIEPNKGEITIEKKTVDNIKTIQINQNNI